MTPRPEEICLIVGAGISGPAASTLPIAGELVKLALHPVAAADEVDPCGSQVCALLKEQLLEIILGGLTEGLPEGRDEVAWRIYAPALGLAPTPGSSPTSSCVVHPYVTTNQDPLLEVAFQDLSGDSVESRALFDEHGTEEKGAGDLWMPRADPGAR